MNVMPTKCCPKSYVLLHVTLGTRIHVCVNVGALCMLCVRKKKEMANIESFAENTANSNNIPISA